MMMATSGESVIGTAITMATVHVGAVTVGAAVWRMTKSNEPRSACGVESIAIHAHPRFIARSHALFDR
ncbi:hypothetical protein AC629_41555 [Bradyrhizobium sp. NAS80.1]|nr:hypothetical protein AC629_41555 [Bradyrhizobium sp. NAS80.1]